MKKDYIKPQILMERMQFCNMIAESNDFIDHKPGEVIEGGEGDAKMFGRFDYFEDEDY